MLNGILTRSRKGVPLDREEVNFLLRLRETEPMEAVMQAAREVRARVFGPRVFLYGFVYFSTHCRNNCSFCFYRNGNSRSPRYRKTKQEVVEIASGLAESGVHLIDLTMGEDPGLLPPGRR